MTTNNFASDGTNNTPSNLRAPGSGPGISGRSYGTQHQYVVGEDLSHDLGQGAVMRNGSKVAVEDYSQAKDTDRVKIGGMEVTVKVAREMGLLNKTDRPEDTPKAEPKIEWKDPRQVAEEAPIAEPEVITSFGSLELSLGSTERADELVTSVADYLAEHGSASMETVEAWATKYNQQPQEMINVLQKGIAAQTKVVMRVLGQDGYDAINTAATYDPAINAEVKALISKTGKGKASRADWSKLLQKVQAKSGKATGR